MFNTAYPTQADLPTTERLIRSTAIAAIAAVGILVTVVLPSEYGIDITGFGRLTGLTTMGEIKMQLAEEAAANEALSAAVANGTAVPVQATITPDPQLADRITALENVVRAMATQVMSSQPQPMEVPAAPTAIAPPAAAPAVQQQAAAAPAAEPAASGWKDEIRFTLTPGQGSEYKLVMQAGATATFEFAVNGGVVNYDAHGEGGGQSLSYGVVRGVAGDSGQLTPPINGTHGWYFRNRGNSDVVVTLRTGGQYSELRKVS